jgi:hypothetical protein
MKIKEIIDYYYNPSSDSIEVSFRVAGDPETQMREAEFEISLTKDYGYLIIESDSYESEDLYLSYEEDTDELFVGDRDDFQEIKIDKQELKNFLTEYYEENSDDLPKSVPF